MNFEPWMLAAIDEAGYNGIEERHIDRVVEEVRKLGMSEVDRGSFDLACRRAMVDPALLTDEDIAEIQRKLNG